MKIMELSSFLIQKDLIEEILNDRLLKQFMLKRKTYIPYLLLNYSTENAFEKW